MGERRESHLALVLDLTSARALAWIATRSPGAELTPEAHLFFYDRYTRLAAWHRKHGHSARAVRISAKAEEHWEASGGSGPPYAAAMALPRPRAWVGTDAVSRRRLCGPDDEAA
jgi:hypothetical protein